MSKYKPLPSQEYLKECFNYDEENGILSWKERPLSHFKSEHIWKMRNSKFSNKIIGHTINTGYIGASLDGVNYVIHRIIWKIVTGNDPIGVIDHIDNDKSNNKFSNLRDVNNLINQQNKRKPLNNSTGHKNIMLCKRSGKYTVTIVRNKISYYIGLFSDLSEAILKRDIFNADFQSNMVDSNSWVVKRKQNQPELTLGVLKLLLRYENGNLIWKHREYGTLGMSDRQIKSFNVKYAGKIINGVTDSKYIRFELFRKKYLAHRIIYQLFNNLDSLPVDLVVDHRDGNTLNNKIENLKLATRIENGINKCISKNNKTGFAGVSISNSGKFTSAIRINGKNIRLGSYDTLEEAVEVRENKREELYGEKIEVR